MHLLITATAVWPGLPQAWLLGRWQALGLAAVFAAALNVALVLTFVWPAWPAAAMPGATAVLAWVLVLSLWIVGLRATRRDWRLICPPVAANREPQLDQWFQEAQTQYLKGHWIEAETLVRRILARNPDVEATLLLASLQRRTKRSSQARQTLNELSTTPAAARWQHEIATELKQLSEQESDVTETTARPSQPAIRQAA